MAPKWIFIEDRDFETGHGWRDRIIDGDSDGEFEYKISVTRDGSLVFCENGKIQHSIFLTSSYAWICRAEDYDRKKHIVDNIRTKHLKEDFPNFKGSSDMESHFEFKMTPEEMKKYLLSLGFEERE